MLRRICIVQIQPRKPVLDHADGTASTRQRVPIDHTDQESISPEDLDQVRIDALS